MPHDLIYKKIRPQIPQGDNLVYLQDTSMVGLITKIFLENLYYIFNELQEIPLYGLQRYHTFHCICQHTRNTKGSLPHFKVF